MKNVKRSIVLTSQAGFSLVELMVVVAIIGILAAMSVGQVQKQIAKARQSEAKTSLAALYTAEKSFAAEFSTYCTDFQVIGLSYEGNMRYSAGFGADDVNLAAATAAGYPGAGSGVFAATAAACGGSCTIINSNGAAPANPDPSAATTANTFIGKSNAQIYVAGTNDGWEINQNKILTNPQAGIP